MHNYYSSMTISNKDEKNILHWPRKLCLHSLIFIQKLYSQIGRLYYTHFHLFSDQTNLIIFRRPETDYLNDSCLCYTSLIISINFLPNFKSQAQSKQPASRSVRFISWAQNPCLWDWKCWFQDSSSERRGLSRPVGELPWRFYAPRRLSGWLGESVAFWRWVFNLCDQFFQSPGTIFSWNFTQPLALDATKEMPAFWLRATNFGLIMYLCSITKPVVNQLLDSVEEFAVI